MVGRMAGQIRLSSMQVIDSHTGGEPTRVVIEGGPDLGSGTMRERLERFADGFDDIRKTLILEPRGSDAMVGALLCEPTRDDCAAGVIYFNNTGYLGMCGHGTIGVAVTLHYLGRTGLGEIRLETPVGVVTVDLTDPNTATIENVPSYRYRSDVAVEVPGIGEVRGDIAWGGNWFFLVGESPVPVEFANERALTDAASRVSEALIEAGMTGEEGALIDHIEFFADTPTADSRNFVLCPGGAYDRSPCGTGTSAKLACLAADGKLAEGEIWVQESVIGSRFTGRYRRTDGDRIIPSITGTAYICGETTLVQQDGDPFASGIA